MEKLEKKSGVLSSGLGRLPSKLFFWKVVLDCGSQLPCGPAVKQADVEHVCTFAG